MPSHLAAHRLSHTVEPAQQEDAASTFLQRVAQARKRVGAVDVLLKLERQDGAGDVYADAIGYSLNVPVS